MTEKREAVCTCFAGGSPYIPHNKSCQMVIGVEAYDAKQARRKALSIAEVIDENAAIARKFISPERLKREASAELVKRIDVEFDQYRELEDFIMTSHLSRTLSDWQPCCPPELNAEPSGVCRVAHGSLDGVYITGSHGRYTIRVKGQAKWHEFTMRMTNIEELKPLAERVALALGWTL